MREDEKLELALRLIASTSRAVLIAAGVAYDAYLEDLRDGKVIALVRPLGTSADRVRRGFAFAQIEDLAETDTEDLGDRLGGSELEALSEALKDQARRIEGKSIAEVLAERGVRKRNSHDQVRDWFRRQRGREMAPGSEVSMVENPRMPGSFTVTVREPGARTADRFQLTLVH